MTIDGPAGAGKSSIARQVADRLGFDFLDTGAMYRAVTLGAIRAQIDLQDVDAVVEFAKGVQLRWDDHKIYLDGVDVTDEIRSPVVTSAIRHIADLTEVRRQLSKQQRRIAKGRSIVTEGRDQGADVFPDAACKIFLTASPEERARRRQQQLSDLGRYLPLEDVLKAQDQRDAEDQDRPIGALRPADDAVIINSDGMTADEVLQRAIEIVEQTIESSNIKD